MNSVSEEFKHRFPKLAANIALAGAFAAIGALSSVVLANVAEGVGFYSWLAWTLVGGAFLVRGLRDILTVSDKTVELLLKHLGIQQRWSKGRMGKDLVCIIATMLATAAIFPFFDALNTARSVLQAATAAVATGIIFLFAYDIARTSYHILRKKATALTNRFGRDSVEEME